jgi:hypothetical protein
MIFYKPRIADVRSAKTTLLNPHADMILYESVSANFDGRMTDYTGRWKSESTRINENCIFCISDFVICET